MTGTGKTPEDYQPEDFITDESFVNYCFHLNKADEVFWEKWLMRHPHHVGLVETARDLLGTLTIALPEQEYKIELEKIRKAINYETVPVSTGKPGIIRFLHRDKVFFPAKKSSGKAARIWVAAAVIFLIAGFFFLQHYTAKTNSLLVKINNSGKPVVLTLSDGTVVTLAAQCKFRYPEEFGGNDRKVYLDGEAQFQVSSDEAHPFKVYAGDLIATVLGTVFNIKKQPGDSGMLIELIKGRLKVEAINSAGLTAQSVILNPDERVVYSRAGKKLFKEKWQSQAEPAATPNHFLFRQSNFDDIADKIKRAFGVTVVNQSNKKNWRFTGEFKNTSAKEIIESICLIKSLNYKEVSDTIFISNQVTPK